MMLNVLLFRQQNDRTYGSYGQEVEVLKLPPEVNLPCHTYEEVKELDKYLGGKETKQFKELVSQYLKLTHSAKLKKNCFFFI